MFLLLFCFALSPAERFGVHHPKLVDTLLRMEKRIERPLAPPELARLADLALRQLERLFADHLGTTIHRRYLHIRLEHARRLLWQSTIAIGEVALATGFATAMHFARCYRHQFGVTPREERRAR